MGGVFSHEMSYYNEEDAAKVKDSFARSTPSPRSQDPRLRNMRLLAIDPRSPSEFINRTPIIVEKTPDLLAKKMKSAHSVTDTFYDYPVKDPRSPTMEFTRTPINPCHTSSATVVHRNITAACHSEEAKVCESKSHTEPAIVPSPFKPVLKQSGSSTCQQEDLGSEVIQEHKSLVLLDKESDPYVNDVEPTALSDSNEKDVGYKKTDGPVKPVENKFLARVKPVDESTPKTSAVIPTVCNNRIRMKPKMLSLQPSVTRSPLSTMQNSPRKLSDRPRLSSNGGKSVQIHNIALDKENVCH